MALNVEGAPPIVELLLADRIVVTPRIEAAALEGYDVQIPLATGAIMGNRLS